MEAPLADQPRYHALDHLRATLMGLGVILHAALNYMTIPPDDIWPYRDTRTSPLFNLVVFYIHTFRMPVFFVLAGLFGALLVAQRGVATYGAHRATRLLLPFVVGLLVIHPLRTLGFTFAQYAGTSHGLERMVAQMHDIGLTPWHTGHLWFLYFLLIFSVCAICLTLLQAQLVRFHRVRALCHRASDRFRRTLCTPWRPIFFASPTTAGLMTMEESILATSHAFLPPLNLLLTYGYFFGFGWLLYAHRDLLATFSRGAWLHVGATILVLLVIGCIYRLAPLDAHSTGRITAPRVAFAFGGALIAWLMVFGLVGLFWRYSAQCANRLGRYFADASYWVYLVHVPIIIWLVGLLAPTDIAPIVKWSLVCGGATLLSLLTYDVFVRPTIVGVVLNGRRSRSVTRES